MVLIAAILRFVTSAHPPGKIFDEIYYATDAYGLLSNGVEWNDKDNVAVVRGAPAAGQVADRARRVGVRLQDADGNVRAAGHIMTTVAGVRLALLRRGGRHAARC